ncbi:hypothetical protein GOBAR_AA16623 [Gossypium barbadense]|uniref:Uncharacterized protein n=1 Tax=Gossypium barbadense TaxID=3634 RepID=A0A2P5XL19_GOSBA|nr:hypothetical protein GOBAR_AA16623 [Gossypium barbadense]
MLMTTLAGGGKKRENSQLSTTSYSVDPHDMSNNESHWRWLWHVREFCAEVETVSHVLRGCLEALATWVRLVKRDELDEFLSMELQQWFVLDLSDASNFSNEGSVVIENWCMIRWIPLPQGWLGHWVSGKSSLKLIARPCDKVIDNRGGELMANAVAQTMSRMRLLNWGHLNMLEDCILSGHR